jgi:hypothetical protein
MTHNTEIENRLGAGQEQFHQFPFVVSDNGREVGLAETGRSNRTTSILFPRSPFFLPLSEAAQGSDGEITAQVVREE